MPCFTFSEFIRFFLLNLSTSEDFRNDDSEWVQCLKIDGNGVTHQARQTSVMRTLSRCHACAVSRKKFCLRKSMPHKYYKNIGETWVHVLSWGSGIVIFYLKSWRSGEILPSIARSRRKQSNFRAFLTIASFSFNSMGTENYTINLTASRQRIIYGKNYSAGIQWVYGQEEIIFKHCSCFKQRGHHSTTRQGNSRMSCECSVC